MNIRLVTKKVAVPLLCAIAGLSVIQVASYEKQHQRLEAPAAESIPYHLTLLPPELAPFQARMILNGLRLQPGDRITLVTSSFRKDEVTFLLDIARVAFKDIGISLNPQKSNLFLSVPPNPNLKNKVVFINTWDGKVEIGLSELRPSN